MSYPVRILQFGDGVFLRAFFDWMVERMNGQGLFGGSVAVVKPRPGDFSPAYARQGNEYTVALKGILDGKRVETRERLHSIARLVNPYADFEAYLAEAANPDLVCIVSNTTESGICASSGDRAEDRPAPSFPGKLTQLLRARYEAFKGDPGKGLVIIPCELIEDNAQILKGLVLDHAARWYADPGFETWLREANSWTDSLVDRIVTGFTEAEKKAILAAEGFADDLVAVAEPYHLLALRGKPALGALLPFRAAGLNVVWAEDISPWRELKVRLLNGSHTLLALCGLALGRRIVLECVGDSLLMGAVRAYQLQETIPTMGGEGSPISAEEARRYLEGVIERFSNPDLAHKLEGIASKSVAKYAARIMPTVRGRVKATGRAPTMAAFILAALVDRYTSGAEGLVVQDEPAAVDYFASRRSTFMAAPSASLTAAFADALGPTGPWGGASGGLGTQAELGDLAEVAASWLARIRTAGMAEALAEATAKAAV
jgi:tagaturonate reductase